MAIRIQKTNNIKLQKINMAIVGPSKSGKTSLAKTIKGKVLILNMDKGILSLKDKSLDSIRITTWSEKDPNDDQATPFVECMKYITTSAHFVKQGYDWVMLDSVSAAAELLEKHMEEKGITGFDFWGEYKKLMGGIMATTRDTNRFNSISIFEVQEKENSSGLLEKKFGIQGAMMSKAPYFYDFVLATKKIEATKDKKAQYVLQSTNKGGYNFLGGRGVNLNDYEPSNIEHILTKLRGGK